jgi:hypothetical protein
MADLAGLPVVERIKLMAAMLVNGNTAQVDHAMDRMGGGELKEFASHCLRMLAEVKKPQASATGTES